MTTTRAPNSMFEMSGWVEVTCLAADVIRRHGMSVASSLTDPRGNFGPPLIFTEWWWAGTPVLRDYQYPTPAAVRCAHFVASTTEAWRSEERP